MVTNERPSTSIGSVLIRMGCITPEQVEASTLAHSRQSERRLGEVMVWLGHITEEQLEAALAYQARMRSGDASGVMIELISKRNLSMMPIGEHAA